MSLLGSKTKGLLWVVAACALAVGLAFGLPWGAKRLPWGVERWMARVLGAGTSAPVCKGGVRAASGASTEPAPAASTASAAALAALVQRLYPLYPDDRKVPITVDVLAGDSVNAYAALGGHIHVFDGLLRQAQSPEELAGVLAHEVEHVRNRHITQDLAARLLTISVLSAVMPDQAGQAQAAYLLLTLKFSREQESEADRLGLERLKAAHIDAEGFRQFFSRARKLSAAPQFLSSHPDDDSRAELAAAYRDYPVEPVLADAQWQALRNICR
jgi:predicted Zn-dependent protease